MYYYKCDIKLKLNKKKKKESSIRQRKVKSCTFYN